VAADETVLNIARKKYKKATQKILEKKKKMFFVEGKCLLFQ
jgi:hypothetical protein